MYAEVSKYWLGSHPLARTALLWEPGFKLGKNLPEEALSWFQRLLMVMLRGEPVARVIIPLSRQPPATASRTPPEVGPGSDRLIHPFSES